jgi:hypothetical protein
MVTTPVFHGQFISLICPEIPESQEGDVSFKKESIQPDSLPDKIRKIQIASIFSAYL